MSTDVQHAALADRRGRHRRARVLLVLAGALLLLVLPAFLGTDYWGYVWPDRLFDHQLIIGGAAWLLVVLATLLVLRGWRLAVALAGLFLLGLAGLAWCVLGHVFGTSPAPDLGVIANHDRTLQSRVAVGGIIDPIYEVHVEQTSRGLLNRTFLVGCIDGDALSLVRMRWEGDALIADTTSGSIAVRVSETGAIGEPYPVAAEAAGGEGGYPPVTYSAC